MKKTANVKNFIGIYDGYITEEECKNAISIFDSQEKLRNTFSRLQIEKIDLKYKQDKHLFCNGANVEIWYEDLKSLIVNFDLAWKHYSTIVGADEAFQVDFHYTTLKIQKTLPTEGYHIWHLEHGKGFENESRAFVFSVYLNDVEEGGETEFLHQATRVKPKTGRIVIWPASFPYLHRGNPPLSGEKYILTSWLRLRP
jgi:hypothetical protein|tara:strand:- start:1377 stop:1970 length:594 start_codon:yes stop_codon:yes gene_type:complete